MIPFEFKPLLHPFPRWMGPFSPSRGKKSGFRVQQETIRAWVDEGTSWQVYECLGVRSIVRIVKFYWKGGRILFLPNGFVVKPLQEDDEVGQRVLIGRFRGSILLKRPEGSDFDLSSPGNLKPGDPWPGPKTTGLECIIDGTGALSCSWYHPTRLGREDVFEKLRGPDHMLAAGFRRARPVDSGGRVRITANGHIITNRQERDGSWVAYYVGPIDSAEWKTDWQKWIRRESP
jgi:hypothetical protein